MKRYRPLLAALTAASFLWAFVPAAEATISPTLTLDQSAGNHAGSTVALGSDIVFAPNSANDTAKDITLILPPGLLADATIGGGTCIQTTAPAKSLPPSACRIGTGTAKTHAGTPPGFAFSAPIALYLVAPPNAGDLAGVAIYLTNTNQLLGTPGDVTVRPSSDPNGVGLTIAFKNVPKSVSFGGPPVPLSLDELQTTLSGMRMPDACPSTPVNYTITADSYSDPTVKTASAPMPITGCSSLQVTPTFAVTATRDTADSGVEVTTDLQQPNGPTQATSSVVVLTLPNNVLAPNAAGVINGGILCSDATFATCKSVGTVTAASPLYPKALTGNAFLTGALATPQLALSFPAPFPITLYGKVDLSTGATTFSGVPDIPLTDLKVDLTGGPNSVFTATCNPSSGTASAALTSQNGDVTSTASAPLNVTGCPPPSTQPGQGGGPSGGGPGTTGGGTPPPAVGLPRVNSASIRRLSHHRLALRIGLLAGANAPGIASVSVTVPHGLLLSMRHRGHLLKLVRVSTVGARVVGIRLQARRIVLKFRYATPNVTLTLRGVTEDASVARAAKRHHPLRRVHIVVLVTDAAGARHRIASTLHVRM